MNTEKTKSGCRHLRYLATACALFLALWAHANPIDSLIQSFDQKPNIGTANKFLNILHQGGLAEEPVVFTAKTHPDTLQMQMWYWATEYYHAVQQYERATAYGLRALPLCHAGEDLTTEGNLLSVLSVCYVRLGDFKNAAVYAKRCNEIDMQQGDPDCISSSLNVLAGIYMSSHQPEEAEKYIMQALSYAQKADNPARLAIINGMASEVYKNLHNDTLALMYATRAYELETALGRPDKAAVRQTEMASALVGLQRAAEAKEVLRKAIPELRKAENLHSLGIACNHMGLLLIQEHRNDEAVQYFNEALEIFTRQGDIYNEALCHRGLYQALREAAPREAMLHNDRYNELRDSLYDEDTRELLSQYSAELGVEQLLRENEAMQRNHRRALLFVGLGVVLMITTVWGYHRMRVRRQRRRMAELTERIERITRQYETMRIGRKHEDGETTGTAHEGDTTSAASPLKEYDRDFVLRLVGAVNQTIAQRNCNVDAIATLLNMSTTTFRRRVLEATGDSPKAVITAIQMQKACILLTERSDRSIGDVASLCGFDETGNFTRTFKRTFGMTPSQFVRQEQKKGGTTQMTTEEILQKMKNGAYMLLPLALTLLTACHDTLPLPGTRWKQVTVVYMMAENSLSDYAQRDLEEIRRAMGNIPDSCRMVVYFDNSRNDEQPYLLTLDNQEGEKILFQYKNDPISTDSTTVQDILNLIVRKCPAENYGLVMWSHGSGWIPARPQRTIGFDNGQNRTSNTGTELEISTLGHILQQTGVHWDYVMFDACFMQGVEVAYELRNVTDWCIGSPAEIPADGAPYHILMPHFFGKASEAWRIAEEYYKYYQETFGLVISATKTSELDNLAASTAPLISALTSYPTEGVQQYMGWNEESQRYPEYFDLGSAMAHWLSEADYALWREAVLQAVPHVYTSPTWVTAYKYFEAELTDPDHVAALSMYIPIEGRALNESFTRTSWYKAAGWSK
ncbi:MAG: helix-turn-helix domain-containing protein [Bacteroidaceae bacterium]|nr:helix-turn-helix domain-containing protein [Bacteroidaceae bacterium]